MLDLNRLLGLKIYGYSKLKILYDHCRRWGYDIPSLSEEDLKRTVEQIAVNDLLGCFSDVHKQESEGGVVDVFTAFMTPKKSQVSTKPNTWRDVHQDWTEPYNDFSLRALTDVIGRFERFNDPDDRFYARTITLVQSSGMGKSRLLAEFGKRYPSMTFCLRPEYGGYPPPDSGVLRSILAPMPFDISSSHRRAHSSFEHDRELFLLWAHALAASYLQASFDYCSYTLFQPLFPAGRRDGGLTRNGPFLVTQWINRNMEGFSSRTDLAMKWHNDHNQYIQTENRSPSCQQSRYDAYNRICSDTASLAKKLARDEAFQKVFDPVHGRYQIRKGLERENGPLQPLFTSADALLEKLGGIKGDINSGIQTPIMVIAIDEASCFFGELELNHNGMAHERDSGVVVPDRYIALNRVMSCLRHKAIWMIFASTQSQIIKLMPPVHMIYQQKGSTGSIRFIDPNIGRELEAETEKGKCLRPFSLFPLDIKRPLPELNNVDVRPKDFKAGRKDFEARPKDFYVPVQDYLQVAQIKRFGRPLWTMYDDRIVLKFAEMKLLGGPRHDYDASNKNHVFAVMSARVNLDVAITNPRAILFSSDAVDGHLRVATRVRIDPPSFKTHSPSEPIVARAASGLLCSLEYAWSWSLRTLHRELLSPGLIDAGPRGTLAARFLMILAQDSLRFSRPRRFDQNYMFTVNHLLRSLLTSTHHHVLNHLDQDISESWMNFSHFASTSSSMKEDEQRWIACELLRRNAAIHCAGYQQDYDQYLPSYAGNISSVIDPKKIVHIFVKVTKGKKKSNPGEELGVHDVEASESIWESSSRAAKETGASTSPTARRSRKLMIWMDLGIQSAEHTVKLYRPRDEAQDPTWVLQCIGASSHVYGCLKTMDCQKAWEQCFGMDSEDQFDSVDLGEMDSPYLGLDLSDKGLERMERMY